MRESKIRLESKRQRAKEPLRATGTTRRRTPYTYDIYIYIYMCVCTFIQRDKEREREASGEGDGECHDMQCVIAHTMTCSVSLHTPSDAVSSYIQYAIRYSLLLHTLSNQHSAIRNWTQCTEYIYI